MTTLNLSLEDLNRALVDQMFKDCQRAGAPSSYLTDTQEIFVRSELMTNESCVVVPLPGILSTEVPPTTELPDPIILREREDGKGDTYLQLRGKNILLRSETLRRGGRYLVLYLLDDNVSLDIIPVTDDLIEQISVHQMCAQSRHFHHDEPPEETPKDPFDVPIVARRAIVVTPRPAQSVSQTTILSAGVN
ncbi:hypothetical protein VSR82_38185 [Burkholderia sp. JPY481]